MKSTQIDLATYEQRTYLLTYREELLSDDPVRICITIPVEEAELRRTVDERMNVIDVSR